MLGKAIVEHAVPCLALSGFDWRVCHELTLKAMGVPNWVKLERTSAKLVMCSDGLETRFILLCNPRMPGQRSDGSTSIDSRLSVLRGVGSDLLEREIGGEVAATDPFLVAPWGDAEMLGHCVLRVFESAGPPVGKGMPGSVFEPLPPKGRIGMHRAALSGDMQSLPTRPRRVDPPDEDGITPLMLASGAGHLPMVKRLLEMGADYTLVDLQGRTAVHHAARSGNAEVMQAMLGAGADAAAGDVADETALHVVAARGDLALVECLVGAGANVDAVDGLYGSTALHRAARGDHAAVIGALVAAGASVDARNEAGRTPLQVAAGFASAEALEVLLAAGADVNATDDRLETALHRPVFFQHMGIIEMLLAHGVNVAAADVEGNTALHVAALMNRNRAAERLLAVGAHVEALNVEGLTALDLAIVNYHLSTIKHGVERNAEVADVLLSHGATVAPMRLPVADRHLLWPHLTPRKLLRRGTGDINYYKLPDVPKAVRRKLPSRSSESYPSVCSSVGALSLLHDAVAKNLPRVVEALLDSGASAMTATRCLGIGTPLHVAVRGGNIDMVKRLLGRGADVNMIAANAPLPKYFSAYLTMTPLHIAAQEKDFDVIKLLVDHGADLNKVAIQSSSVPWTATDYAERVEELYDYLRANGGKKAEELKLRRLPRPP